MSDLDRNIRPYYTISCYSKQEDGDIDLSSNLMNVSIISTVNSPYQTVLTSFLIDSKIMVRKDLFGKNDLVLEIQLMKEDVAPTERFSLELITIRQDAALSLKNATELGVGVQDVLTLVNVIKKPFLEMSTTVNMLFDESHRKTPIEMVQQIITDFLPDMNTDIVTNNQNIEKIFQFIVKPMSLIDSIKYIDGSDSKITKKYGPGVGIFNGPLFFTNRFEIDGTNTLCMWDLSTTMKNEAAYTVYQLSTGGQDLEIMEKAGVKNNVFYTVNSVNHIYRGNQDIISNGYINRFISKPSDNLYSLVDLTMDDIFNNNAIRDGNELNINEVLHDYTNYHTSGEVGLETSDVPYRSRLSRKVSALSEIEIHVDRNLALSQLSKVGVPIKFIPQSQDYIDTGGKYIVNNNRINFNRETDSWVCRVRIRASRGNLKGNQEG